MSHIEEEVQALRQRLATFEKDALVEMCVQLSRTYVLEGAGTLAATTAATTPAGEETFAGLLRRLMRERPDDPVLSRFIVNGEHIQVKTPAGNVDVTEYRRPVPPRPSPNPPAVPTPSDSVYNRPQQVAPPTPPRSDSSRPTPASAATEKPPPDRMSLIELD